MAVFVHHTVKRTFSAKYGTFCTSCCQAYNLCSIRHFLHIVLSGVHFELKQAVLYIILSVYVLNSTCGRKLSLKGILCKGKKKKKKIHCLDLF